MKVADFEREFNSELRKAAPHLEAEWGLIYEDSESFQQVVVSNPWRHVRRRVRFSWDAIYARPAPLSEMVATIVRSMQ